MPSLSYTATYGACSSIGSATVLRSRKSASTTAMCTNFAVGHKNSSPTPSLVSITWPVLCVMSMPSLMAARSTVSSRHSKPTLPTCACPTKLSAPGLTMPQSSPTNPSSAIHTLTRTRKPQPQPRRQLSPHSPATRLFLCPMLRFLPNRSHCFTPLSPARGPWSTVCRSSPGSP